MKGKELSRSHYTTLPFCVRGGNERYGWYVPSRTARERQSPEEILYMPKTTCAILLLLLPPASKNRAYNKEPSASNNQAGDDQSGRGKRIRERQGVVGGDNGNVLAE